MPEANPPQALSDVQTPLLNYIDNRWAAVYNR